jgi:hypothetical protein
MPRRTRRELAPRNYGSPSAKAAGIASLLAMASAFALMFFTLALVLVDAYGSAFAGESPRTARQSGDRPYDHFWIIVVSYALTFVLTFVGALSVLRNRKLGATFLAVALVAAVISWAQLARTDAISISRWWTVGLLGLPTLAAVLPAVLTTKVIALRD